MPFDGSCDERLARLEILAEIAAKSRGDQSDFTTCLLADCQRDGRLGALPRPIDHMELVGLGKQFGISWLFGCDPIEVKRGAISAAILRRREMMEAEHAV